MNFILTVVDSVILILLIIRQIKIWQWRCFISPGFYFGFLWVLGVIGVFVFSSLEIFPITFPEYLDELNIYVGFTGLCFLLVTDKGRNTINENGMIFAFIPSFRIFLMFSSLLLIVAFTVFVLNGASFNMGAARERMHETLANQSVWVGYVGALSTVLSICAGYMYGKFFMGQTKLSYFRMVICLFPMISGLLFSLYLGGRVNFVYSIVEYVIGFSLAIPIHPAKKVNKKIVIYSLSGFVLVSFFISLVAAQRQEYYGGASYQYNIVKEAYPVMSVVYGPMEYMVSSYLGYQYRRDDLVDLNNLGYGLYTFNGFINWTLPFAGRLELENFSIAKIFGVYHDPQASYDFSRIYYYTTHSCFIPIVQDFGKWGAFPFILFLVYISHNLFVNIQKKYRIRYSSSLFMFYLFLFYWLKSNYYGYLMNSVIVLLYGFIIIDIVNLFRYKGNR